MVACPNHFTLMLAEFGTFTTLTSAIDTLKSGEIRNPWDRDKGVAV